MRLFIHDIEPSLYLDIIESRFPGLEIFTHSTYAGVEELVEKAQPDFVMQQVFASGKYPREGFLNCKSIQWIHVMGAGVNHLAPWEPETMTVTNSATVQADAMAQYAVGGLIALNFRYPEYRNDKNSHKWNPVRTKSAKGLTMLVLGLGPIGQTVARHAKAIGMRVIGLRRRPEPIEGIDAIYSPDRLHEALAEADVACIVLPLTSSTRGMFDAKAFEAMKPGAIFINIGRGPIVDEAALIDALCTKLRGAVLDVFAIEPLPADSPLWDLENAIMTPHVSSVFEGWERGVAELFCDNLERRLKGDPMLNFITPP